MAVRGAGVESAGRGGTGHVRLGPGDLRFILVSLASIWLCMIPPTARLRRAVMGSALANLLQDGDEEVDLHSSRML